MMKKYIAFIVAAVMLILAACQPPQQGQQGQPETQPTTTAPTQTTTAPTETAKPTETTVPTETTKPTETTVPPTTVPPTTVAPTETTTPPTETVRDPSVPGSYGYTFVYNGSNPAVGIEPDLSECVLGYFYYLDLDTGSVFFICEDEIFAKASSDTAVFFVKNDDRTKIYTAPLADLTQHTVIYESTHGEIAEYLYTGPYQYEDTVLEFVEGNKRLIWFELETGTAEVMMEQYYIMNASVDSGQIEWIDGEPYLCDRNIIYFVGKLSENDELKEYFYYRDTGEIEIDTSL